MGESVIKGKKIRKESRLQNEGMRGFSSSRFGGFFWGRLTYIYVREESERHEDSFDYEGSKGVEEQEKGDCSQESARFFLQIAKTEIYG